MLLCCTGKECQGVGARERQGLMVGYLGYIHPCRYHATNSAGADRILISPVPVVFWLRSISACSIRLGRRGKCVPVFVILFVGVGHLKRAERYVPPWLDADFLPLRIRFLSSSRIGDGVSDGVGAYDQPI